MEIYAYLEYHINSMSSNVYQNSTYFISCFFHIALSLQQPPTLKFPIISTNRLFRNLSFSYEHHVGLLEIGTYLEILVTI